MLGMVAVRVFASCFEIVLFYFLITILIPLIGPLSPSVQSIAIVKSVKIAALTAILIRGYSEGDFVILDPSERLKSALHLKPNVRAYIFRRYLWIRDYMFFAITVSVIIFYFSLAKAPLLASLEPFRASIEIYLPNLIALFPILFYVGTNYVCLDVLPVLPSFIRRVCSGYAPGWGLLQTPRV